MFTLVALEQKRIPRGYNRREERALTWQLTRLVFDCKLIENEYVNASINEARRETVSFLLHSSIYDSTQSSTLEEEVVSIFDGDDDVRRHNKKPVGVLQSLWWSFVPVT